VQERYGRGRRLPGIGKLYGLIECLVEVVLAQGVAIYWASRQPLGIQRADEVDPVRSVPQYFVVAETGPDV
jgi:hypothetical protein